MHFYITTKKEKLQEILSSPQVTRIFNMPYLVTDFDN